MGLVDWFLGREAPAAPALPTGFDPALAGLFAGIGSPQLAERIGTAARCLQLVAQQLSAMPLRFRGSSPRPLWVANPDPAWFPNGIAEALFAAFWSQYGHGDAFLLVTDRYVTGFPRAWTVLDPTVVTVNAAPDGDGRIYRVRGLELDPDDVLQISRDPRGTLRGTSALQAYSSNVASSFAAESYAADMLTGGGVPWAVLQPAKRIDEAQATAMQAQWVSAAARRGGAPAVIPPDVAFEKFSFSPKDLALLETREWDAKQIAAAFGVPGFMLNMDQGGGLNYSNPEMLFDTWWRTELYPAGRRFEAAVSTWLPAGSWVEFDPAVMLRPDLKTMADVWLQLEGAGVVTKDEVRAAVLDLPPLEDGDALPLLDEPAGAGAPPSDVPAPPVVPTLEVVS